MERSPFWAAARAAAVLGAALGMLLVPAAAEEKRPLIVFAAASLKNALDEIGAAWTQESAVTVRASYAATSALAKQIEQGAPADLFLSADADWMNYVEGKRLLRDGTRRALLGNALVLVAAQGWEHGAVKIEQGFALAELIGGGRLAVAATVSVPAGKYAKAALQKLGVWHSVETKLAEAENVRAALAYVARGEAPLGIVYRTDATAERNVIVVGSFPADSHPPITYPVAIPDASRNPAAERFHKYLAGPTARALFEKHGFAVHGNGSPS